MSIRAFLDSESLTIKVACVNKLDVSMRSSSASIV